MIKKTCQYMLNVVLHIFSSINFCVRILVFFIIEGNRLFWRYEINRFWICRLLCAPFTRSREKHNSRSWLNRRQRNFHYALKEGALCKRLFFFPEKWEHLTNRTKVYDNIDYTKYLETFFYIQKNLKWRRCSCSNSSPSICAGK